MQQGRGPSSEVGGPARPQTKAVFRADIPPAARALAGAYLAAYYRPKLSPLAAYFYQTERKLIIKQSLGGIIGSHHDALQREDAVEFRALAQHRANPQAGVMALQRMFDDG